MSTNVHLNFYLIAFQLSQPECSNSKSNILSLNFLIFQQIKYEHLKYTFSFARRFPSLLIHFVCVFRLFNRVLHRLSDEIYIFKLSDIRSDSTISDIGWMLGMKNGVSSGVGIDFPIRCRINNIQMNFERLDFLFFSINIPFHTVVIIRYCV